MVEALVLGVVLGGIIALGAVGLSLFYAILRFGHFAHGDLMTLGAYLALAMLAGPLAWLGLRDVSLRPLSIGPGLLLATALAAALITLLVWLLDAGVYAPMRRRGSDATLLAFASLAIAIMVRSVVYMLWGPQPLRYSVELQQAIPLPFGARIKPDELFSLAVVGVIVVALYLFLERTKIGRAMRATADNPELARISGIDAARVIRWTWAIGAGLLTVGGVLYGVQSQLQPVMGWNFLLAFFAATILGSIGNIYGALAGSLVVGIVQQVSTLWISPGYKPGVALAVLILILLVRPQGLFARE
jgi:branched-chain amino acid transport system permease protein